MSTETAMGLVRGDHVCGFYWGEEERDELLFPFLQEGLSGGEKCVVVIDSAQPAEMLARLDEDGSATSAGQLELYHSDETYLRGGSFDPEEMISFWEGRLDDARSTGRYAVARAVGEMSWLERMPPPREFVVRYESWADRFAESHCQAVLCLYDLRRLGSGILMDLLRTHSKLLLRGQIVENPHHLSADEFHTCG